MHKQLFAADSVGRKQLAIIADAVTALGTHASAKMTTARDGTTVKQNARNALVTSLEAVARTARAIALDTPGLEDKFVFGRVIGRSDQELITTGRTFAQAIRDRQAKQDAHLAARTMIETTLALAMTAVHKLDAIVANALQNDPVTTAVWTRDRKVRYPKGEKKEVQPPAATPPETVPTPATPTAPTEPSTSAATKEAA